MPAATRIITNPVTGEELTWLVTSEQSGGTRAKAEIRVHGAGRGNRLPHAHPSAHERFTVVRGRMAVDCAGTVTVLHPGESLTVAPGVEHAWWNARAGELCMHVEISPPGRYEELTELGFRWAREGRVSQCGDPGLVLGAALLAEFGDDIAYEVPPRWVQRVLVPPLARLGRRRHPDLVAAA
jgi:quercetin dioxygenase-like cupin family protein